MERNVGKKPGDLVKERARDLAIRTCVIWLMAAEFRRNGEPEKSAKEWRERARRMSSELAFSGVDPALSDATAQEWLERVEDLIAAALAPKPRRKRAQDDLG